MIVLHVVTGACLYIPLFVYISDIIFVLEIKISYPCAFLPIIIHKNCDFSSLILSFPFLEMRIIADEKQLCESLRGQPTH